MKYFVNFQEQRLQVNSHDEDFLVGKDLCRAISQKIFAMSNIRFKVDESIIAMVIIALGDNEWEQMPETQSEWLVAFAEFILDMLNSIDSAQKIDHGKISYAFRMAETIAEVAEVPVKEICSRYSFVYADDIDVFPEDVKHHLQHKTLEDATLITIVPIEMLPLKPDAMEEIRNGVQMDNSIAVGAIEKTDNPDRPAIAVGVYGWREDPDG